MTASQRLRVHLDFGADSTLMPPGECLWLASQRSSNQGKTAS
jgi:hypothetical protein